MIGIVGRLCPEALPCAHNKNGKISDKQTLILTHIDLPAKMISNTMNFAKQLKELQTKVDNMFLPSTHIFTLVREGELRIASREAAHTNRLRHNKLVHGGNLTGNVFTISLAEKKGTDYTILKKRFKTMYNCDYEKVAPVLKQRHHRGL
jgi:hypothetical protein